MSIHLNNHTYFVSGMHCASCEVLIEKKLAALKEIKSVEASADKGSVFIVYDGEKPNTNRLNKIFRRENYFFSDQPIKIAEKNTTVLRFSRLACGECRHSEKIHIAIIQSTVKNKVRIISTSAIDNICSRITAVTI